MSESKPYYSYASYEDLVGVGADPSKIELHLAENKQDFPPDKFSLNHAELTEEQCAKLIPEGCYCYTFQKDENGLVVTKACPFWDKITDFPKQNNGYCHYLNKGDWQLESFALLWDQVKECGINDNDEDHRFV